MGRFGKQVLWASLGVALLMVALAPTVEAGRGRRFRKARPRVAYLHPERPRLQPKSVLPSVSPVRPQAVQPSDAPAVQAMGIGQVTYSRQMTWITDFGAIPGDGDDDSDAILACIRAAIGSATYNVYFPAGVYDVDSDNVLHPVTAGVATGFGINFMGAAQNFTTIRLHKDGDNERWLYDSDESPGWNRCQFENIWFQSDLLTDENLAPWYDDDYANTGAFRLWATTLSGVDKGFIFRNCRFGGFGQPNTFTGISNTDSNAFYSCWWQSCGPLIFENDQTLAHNFFGCHFWYSEDCFWMKNTTGEGSQGKGGGGWIQFYGSDFIHESFPYTVTGAVNNGSGLIRLTITDNPFQNGDGVSISSVGGVSAAAGHWTVTGRTSTTIDLQGSTFSGTYTSGGKACYDTPYYTWRIDDGAAFVRNIAMRDCQWEMRTTYASRLLHKRGNSSFTFTNEVLFDGCNMSANHGAESGATGREYLTLGGQTYVRFTDCHLPERFGVGFYDVNTSNISLFQYQPLVVLEHCALGPTFLANLATRITYDTGDTNTNNYGRIISRGGRALTSTNLNDNYCFDFDYGKGRAGRGEPSRQQFTVSLKGDHQVWPTLSSGTGSGERTVFLPPGTRILSARINKPAGSSSSTLVSYAIGSDDKSAIFCRSYPGRVDGVHKAFGDGATALGVLPYTVGASGETIRLWMTSYAESSVSTTGGEAVLVCE